MSDQRIHIFARIIQVADLYDRAGSLGGGRQRQPNIQILHLLRTRYESWVDPVVLRALEAVAPPFPPGSTVGLSDGTRAVVTQVHPNDCYRPIVRPLAKDGVAPEGSAIDLRADGAPRIVTSGGMDVQSLLPSALASAA